jgi:hypothetical protein
MKASELRIGNWGHSGITKEDFIIEAHDIVNISGGFDNGKVQPIPLTEEWLVKFGFVKNNSGFYEQKRFTYHPEYGWKILSQWIKGWVNVAEIKYVHQLQNLYFALTGEELKQEQQ